MYSNLHSNQASRPAELPRANANCYRHRIHRIITGENALRGGFTAIRMRFSPPGRRQHRILSYVDRDFSCYLVLDLEQGTYVIRAAKTQVGLVVTFRCFANWIDINGKRTRKKEERILPLEPRLFSTRAFSR